MPKKTSKKTAKKAAPDMEKAFFAAVHPLMAGGFAEPNASEYTRQAYRRFKENLE